MAISKIPGKGTQDLFTNVSDTGTEGTKVAAGTTAQRGSTTGQWRYNTDTGYFEGRNTSGSFSTLEPTPTISSVDDGEVDSAAGGNQTIVITGTNFSAGGTIAFVGTSADFNAATTTYNSTTQVTAVAPKASFLNAQEPYKVKFTSAGGVAGTSSSGLINVDNAPTWTTSSGTVATINDNATGTHATLAASDAEGDTVAYTETGATNLSGAGLSLNSSTGAITGDPTDVAAATTVSFTGRATAGSKTVDRSFSIVVNPAPVWDILGGLSNNAGTALNAAASRIVLFIDPADSNSYSSGSNVTNRAHALNTEFTNNGSATMAMTNMTTGGSGVGKYFVNSSNGSTAYIRANQAPNDGFSNDADDQMAYCGWWYGKEEYDDGGSTVIWILNDGDWGPNGQVGLRLQSGKFRALRGSSNNIQENLPSMTYTNKWLFVCVYQSSNGGMYMGIADKDATNLTDIYDNSSFSLSTGSGTPQPFTIGARPDSLSAYNNDGTRLGFQAMWGGSNGAFLDSTDRSRTRAKALFESIFDATKGRY